MNQLHDNFSSLSLQKFLQKVVKNHVRYRILGRIGIVLCQIFLLALLNLRSFGHRLKLRLGKKVNLLVSGPQGGKGYSYDDFFGELV